MAGDPFATYELDLLRQRLRKPIQAAGILVSEGLIGFGEAADELVSTHALPLLERYADLDLLALEDEISGDLADAAAEHEVAQFNRERAQTPGLHRARLPQSKRTFTGLGPYYPWVTEPVHDA